MFDAMSGIGMPDDERDALLDIMAFVIQLGEVKFEGGDKARISDGTSLQAIEKFIGIKAEQMKDALTSA